MRATRCTASGRERSWSKDAWVGLDSSGASCPDCGHVGDIVWVRGTDLFPRAKTRAHTAPPGVTPAPYAVHPRGGLSAAEVAAAGGDPSTAQQGPL